MLRQLLLLLVLLATGPAVSATTMLLDDFEDFAGAGLRPGGGGGSLDSTAWRIGGLASGDTSFGASIDSGPGARGRARGQIRSGGLYAFAIAGGSALGWQATGANFTPGNLMRIVLNDSRALWRDLWLEFDLWWLNDQPRGSRVDLHGSTTGLDWLPLAEFRTPLSAAAIPVWQQQRFRIPLENLVVPSPGLLLLDWRLADAGGSGSRDELAIDNLKLSSRTPALAVATEGNSALYGLTGLLLWYCARRRRSRAAMNKR